MKPLRTAFANELANVVAILGLGTLSISILQPVLPLYLTAIGVPATILGLMFSTAMVGMLIGEGSWGWVADRLGLKIPMSAGTFVCALVVSCFVLTREVPFIFLIFFFWGLARAALFPVGRGYIGAKAPGLKKATYMAAFATTLAGSRSLGTFLGGFIIDTLGYHQAFFVSSGIAFLGGILVISRLRHVELVKPRPPVTSLPSNGPSSTENRLNYRPLFFQFAIAALQHLGMGVMTFLPLLATEVIGVSATEAGLLLTVGGLVDMALLIPMGRLADRRGKVTLMTLGLVASAVGFAGVAFAQSYYWLMGAVAVRSLGMAMFGPAAVALLSDTVPPQRQSTAMGLYGADEDIGVIAGSALGGYAWSNWGQQPTFLMGTLTAAMGATLCVGLVKNKTARSPQPSAERPVR